MSELQKPRQCRHIFVEGRQCNAHSLRGENFCYYHHTTRIPAPRPHPSRSAGGSESFELPMPENRAAIQYSIGEVLRRIAANQIDRKSASLLLYGLSIASTNLAGARHDKAPEPLSTPVLEVVIDPEEGLLAPSDEPLQPNQVLLAPGRAYRRQQLHEESRIQARLAEIQAERHAEEEEVTEDTDEESAPLPVPPELERILRFHPPAPRSRRHKSSKLKPWPRPSSSSSSTSTAPSSIHASTSATPSTPPSSISENPSSPKPSSPATSATVQAC